MVPFSVASSTKSLTDLTSYPLRIVHVWFFSNRKDGRQASTHVADIPFKTLALTVLCGFSDMSLKFS